jgi:hypothetical protein
MMIEKGGPWDFLSNFYCIKDPHNSPLNNVLGLDGWVGKDASYSI